jgi:hypothetical protein
LKHANGADAFEAQPENKVTNKKAEVKVSRVGVIKNPYYFIRKLY